MNLREKALVGRMDRRQRRPGSIGAFLLASQLFNVGFNNIPPVTLILICAQAAIYLRLIDIPWSTMEMCVSSELVWHRKQWRRLFLSPFEHADDMHLYYNMVSFMWKGRSLERKYGTKKFTVIVAAFSILCSVVYVALSELAFHIFDDYSYTKSCAVGFSAVIFALKVLTTRHSSQYTYVYGIPVPGKYAYWLELLLIQALVPNASFVGHLAGILVGLAYTKGPLKAILKSIYSSGNSRRFTNNTGHSGYYANYEYQQPTYPPPPYGFNDHQPSPEELRQRRYQYYQ